jgi:alkylhydroperoxidase/carboxymuconolactone decarboxylase family protein YurZ/ketosteroid isomerase-like protein
VGETTSSGEPAGGDLAGLPAEPLDVLHEYFHRIDGRDPGGAALLFAPDARARFMLGPFVEGRDQIAASLQGILTAFSRTSHHVTNVRVVERDGSRAVLALSVYAYHRLAATGKPWHFWGRLRDVFVRHGGSWLIGEHVLDGVDAVPDRRRIPQEGFAGQPGREWVPLPDPGAVEWDALAAASPAAAAAIEEIQADLADSTGIPPPIAALAAASAAAALRFDVGCREALERARRAGLSPAEAWAAASLLLATRGTSVAYAFADALLALYGPPVSAGAAAGGGTVPAATPYERLRAGAGVQTALSRRTVELLLCAVSAAERRTEALQRHVEQALREGAVADEILHALLAVVGVAGADAYAIGEEALARASAST